MRKKYIVTAVAGVALCLALVGTAVAYFSDLGHLDNVLTPGSNTVEVEEKYTPPKELKVDNEIPKEVQIKNNGNVPCFVRVFANFSDSKVRSWAKLKVEDSDEWKAWDQYIQNPPDGWVYQPITIGGATGILDGFFYYTKPLQPGESTSYLFKKVRVTFPGEADIQNFEIIVSAESVQTIGSDGKDYSSEPDGWKTVWTDFLKRTAGTSRTFGN